MRPHTLEEAMAEFQEAIDNGAGADVVVSLGAVVESLVPVSTPNVLGSALWYAQRGLHVFPIQAGQKKPYEGTRGCKDATSDEGLIRGWWDRWPEAGLAIATGHVIDVIDIDGPTGHRSRLDHWDDFATVEVLALVSTPRPGGLHLWRHSQGHGNRAGLLPGIDYRGAGGYVLAPPSVLDDRPGQHPGTYRFIRPPQL